ncbi:MAG: GNAT family N-acetyltransferase [Chloroflexi bacterium]|nr:MAG: GNAT family N-acetyltransferase [Chloroflexota bacterium]
MTANSHTHITLRTATEADIPRITEFIRPFVEEGRLLPRTFNELEELLNNFYLAEIEGEIVGCAALEVYSPKLAEIRSLAVASHVRGSGIGRLLVDACLQEARRRNILEVMVVTSEDGFFLRMGFDFTLPGEKKALFFQTRDNPDT